MPELLLPALSQQPIIVEVAASSWPEWVTPLTSLAGVALGAGLAHWLSKKQEGQRIRQEKLEEIFSACGELEKVFSAYIDGFVDSLYINEHGQVECQRESGAAAQDLKLLMDRVDFLMLVHMPSHSELRDRLRNNVIAAGTKVALIGGSALHITPEEVKSHKKELLDVRGKVSLEIKAVKRASVADARQSLGINE